MKSLDASQRTHEKSLSKILSAHESRKLTINLEFSYKRNIYQITSQGKGYRLRHKMATICDHVDGSQEVFVGEHRLDFKIHKEKSNEPYILDSKDLNPMLDNIVSVAQEKSESMPEIRAA